MSTSLSSVYYFTLCKYDNELSGFDILFVYYLFYIYLSWFLSLYQFLMAAGVIC